MRMTRSISVRVVLLYGMLGTVATACAAQAYTPPPPPLTTLPPCPVDKDAKKRAKRKDCDPTVYPPETVEKKKDASPAIAPPSGGAAADLFPFPGDQPAAATPAAKAFPFPGEASGSAAQDPAAAAKAADTPASKAFPFPGGSTPDVPGESAEPAPKADDSSSSSSSGSSSSSSDDPPADASRGPRSSATKNPDDDDEEQPRLKDKGSEGKRSKKVVKAQTDTERVDEDLSVAEFYGQNGNYMGAYLRAQDAVKTQPEFPEGHFVLGEAAKRLHKKDEAVTEFQAYLKLAPDGPKAKAAETALNDLK